MKKFAKRIIVTLLSACLLFSLGALTVSAEEETAAEDTTVFGAAFEEIKAHSAEILSALAFAGSAILTFTYKRAMMPTLKHGIGAIGGSVSEIKGTQEKLGEGQKKLREELEDRLGAIEALSVNAERALEKSVVMLEKFNTGAAEREKLQALISEQVSLLYDVFMFSSIPEYQKDAVGRRVETMRKLISDCEVTTDEKQDEA